MQSKIGQFLQLSGRSLFMKTSAKNAMTRPRGGGGTPVFCFTPHLPTWSASLGHLATETYSRLNSGYPPGYLDLPVIPVDERSCTVSRCLGELGPLLWRDFSSCTSITWIPKMAFRRIRLPTPYPTSLCPHHPFVTCRGGQFWALRGDTALRAAYTSC